jgi:hypothetical protein
MIDVRDLALAAAVRKRFPFLTALPPRAFPVDEAALEVPALDVDARPVFLDAFIACVTCFSSSSEFMAKSPSSSSDSLLSVSSSSLLSNALIVAFAVAFEVRGALPRLGTEAIVLRSSSSSAERARSDAACFLTELKDPMLKG